MKNKKGFTLIEMLVVVLIIGILAGIALPQYQMAVTKAKVASILPLMRRWKDALAEYKLQHGNYCPDDIGCPNASYLNANWPSDWDDGNCGDNSNCGNDYWSCFACEEPSCYVYCYHSLDSDNDFHILMYQPDDDIYPDVAGMMTCEPSGIEGEKVCKALGGELLEGVSGYNLSTVYKLN